MIKVPYIMEAFDILSRETKKSNVGTKLRNALVYLLRSCFQINTRLLVWHKSLRHEVSGELYTVLPSIARNPADDEIRGRVFPLAIQFPTLSVAQLMLLYWSTMLLLYRIIGDIQKVLQDYNQHASQDTPSSGSGRLLPPAEARGYHGCASEELSVENLPLYYALPESMRQFAASICQSVEYCYQSKNGTLGLQSTVFPIWAAQDFYASQSAMYREWQWCSEIENMTAPDSRFDLKVMKLQKLIE
jgi:hypothetical protein